MDSRIKKIIVGIAVLAVLIVCYFVGSKINSAKQQKDEINQAQTENALSSQTDLVGKVSNDIKNAVITRENDKIELVKLSNGDDISWTVKGYEDVDFNQDNIGILAMSLSTLYANEKICDVNSETSPEQLKEYGLDNPKTVADVNFNDGTNVVINVGNPTSDKLYNYAMVKGGDGVYLIEEINSKRYNYTVMDLVNKDIPIINAVKILYADIKQKDKDEIEIEYKEDAEGNAANLADYGMQALTMKKPVVGAAVYPNNIQTTILKNLSSLQIKDVVDIRPDDLSKYSLDNPYLQVNLKDGENELDLKIGSQADDENYYCMAQGRNIVYTVSKSLIEPFENANIIDFIERFVSLVYKKDVKEVDLNGLGKEYKITFKDNPDEPSDEENDNRIGILNGKELDKDSFSNFYQSIIGITFDSISNTEKIGSEPSVIIKFSLIDGSERTVNYYDYSANNNFYIVEIDGDTSRLVNKQSVKTAFNLAESLT